MDKVTIQEALDYCLENPDGLSVEELLLKFPEHRDELAPLLGLASDIRGSVPAVSPARRSAIKARLMAAAASNRTNGSTDGAAVSPRHLPAPKPLPITQKVTSASRLRGSVWTAAIAAALVALVWYAAAVSLPGSFFYGVKLASENVLLNLASSPADRIRGHAHLADARLFDLRAMNERDQLAQAGQAVDSYRYHLATATALWRQTRSPEREELAEVLYRSSVAGTATFSALNVASDSLPYDLRQSIRDTISALDELGARTSQSLASVRVDLSQVLAATPGETQPLLTPLAVVGVPGTTVISTPSASAANSAPRETVTARATTGSGNRVIPTAASRAATHVAGLAATRTSVRAHTSTPRRPTSTRTSTATSTATPTSTSTATVVVPPTDTPEPPIVEPTNTRPRPAATRARPTRPPQATNVPPGQTRVPPQPTRRPPDVRPTTPANHGVPPHTVLPQQPPPHVEPTRGRDGDNGRGDEERREQEREREERRQQAPEPDAEEKEKP